MLNRVIKCCFYVIFCICLTCGVVYYTIELVGVLNIYSVTGEHI